MGRLFLRHVCKETRQSQRIHGSVKACDQNYFGQTKTKTKPKTIDFSQVGPHILGVSELTDANFHGFLHLQTNPNSKVFIHNRNQWTATTQQQSHAHLKIKVAIEFRVNYWVHSGWYPQL